MRLMRNYFQVLLRLSLIAAAINLGQVSSANLFDRVQGRLCISSQFKELENDQETQGGCAFSCLMKPRCQAFSMQGTGALCTHFVFDKCSKNVSSSCSCSVTGAVFIRRQSGLQPGQLCHESYGNELCGVKYKLISIADGSWVTGRQKCVSEPGLVVMGDIIDAAELNHMISMGSQSFFLSGLQAPGSQEKLGGWSWSSCNIGVDARLWGTGEPDDDDGIGGHEQASGIWMGNRFADLPEIYSGIGAVLCECLSPF